MLALPGIREEKQEGEKQEVITNLKGKEQQWSSLSQTFSSVLCSSKMLELFSLCFSVL